MLKRLIIRNYALIESLEIDFSNKLTIITGETGAGKSILLGALGLIMGERAETKTFYNESEKCVIEGWFDVAKYDLKSFFASNELDYDREVVIRRELTPAGKSRAFINDTPASNQMLKQLTDALIDLHLQFDTLDIHNVNYQLRMIDALANNQSILKDYQAEFQKFSADRRKLQELLQARDSGIKENEFLKFQYEELQAANLQDAEETQLELELAKLSHAEEIKKTSGAAFAQLLDGEHNIVAQLQETQRAIGSLQKYSNDAKSISDRLTSVIIELEDIGSTCEGLLERTEYHPQRIHEVQERLNVLYRLFKKHGKANSTDLLNMQSGLEQQISGYENLDESIAALEKSLAIAEKKLLAIAATLTENRKSVTANFEGKVQEMLTQLSMPHARLKVQIDEAINLSPTGKDVVEFLFATNVGSKFLPIKDVASGGELARLTLCTKSLVADAIPLPTLIFDEIDTGISGDVALKMGKILKELADRHQVVSITHTPQVAARAESHYFVYKVVDGHRTVTKVRLLAREERIKAIATMLSGNPPSDSAIITARELVEG